MPQSLKNLLTSDTIVCTCIFYSKATCAYVHEDQTIEVYCLEGVWKLTKNPIGQYTRTTNRSLQNYKYTCNMRSLYCLYIDNNKTTKPIHYYHWCKLHVHVHCKPGGSISICMYVVYHLSLC